MAEQQNRELVVNRYKDTYLYEVFARGNAAMRVGYYLPGGGFTLEGWGRILGFSLIELQTAIHNFMNSEIEARRMA